MQPEPPRFTPSPKPLPLNDAEVWDRLFYSDCGDVYQHLYDGDLSA